MSELKPCPFCGGNASAYYKKDSDKHWVECDDCVTSTDDFDSADKAIHSWNRRAPGAGQAVLPSEAIFAFCGWLTSRNATIEFGPRCDCAAVADLVQRFCDSQGFEAPRNEVYPHNLKEYPADEPQAQAEPAEGQEPVAIVHRPYNNGGFNVEWLIPTFDLPDGAKLYAQPQRPAEQEQPIAAVIFETGGTRQLVFYEDLHKSYFDRMLEVRYLFDRTQNQRPAIQWSDELKPNSEVHYNHLIGNTPFSRILITWKGWKDDLDMIIDEHPVESAKGKYAGGSIEEAKQTAEKFYLDALKEQPNGQG